MDLHPDYQEIIKRILREWLPQYEVRAFGSRIAGTSRKFSDLDLVVVTESPLAFGLLGGVRDAFSQSDLPFKVDVLDWSAIPQSFREIIQRNYEKIQQAPEGRDSQDG